jgi:hypothetical protein
LLCLTAAENLTVGRFVADIAHLRVVQDIYQTLSPEHARRRIGIYAVDEVPQGGFPAVTEDNHETASSVNNTNVIASHGATPYIAFKSIHSGAAGGFWEKMFHYFAFNRQEFLGHYHKRSNVESTFSMIKAKFREHVRSKTDVAMTNEVLCKVLCHNICCVIQAMYELGIEPNFWSIS